jgi:LysM repeat protein
VHVVQSGETLGSIALKYDVTVQQIRELNAGSIGENNIIRVGQELVISVPDGSPTSTPLPEPPTATPEQENDGTDDESTDESADEGTDEAADEEPVEETAPSPSPEPEGASVCVLAFHDRNGDTVRDSEDEGLLPNVEFTLANASGVVAEYTSDGVSEPYCFTGLEPGSYRVIEEAPAGYEPTGLPEQNVALAAGTSFDLQFGNARTAAAAEEGETGDETESGQDGDETTASVGEGTDETGGAQLFGVVLTNVARIAGVVVLILAGAVAVLFFVSRRRRY